MVALKRSALAYQIVIFALVSGSGVVVAGEASLAISTNATFGSLEEGGIQSESAPGLFFLPELLISEAISFFKGLIGQLNAELQAQRNDESVRARVWMHLGNPSQHGCGFYLGLWGYRGTQRGGYFPGDKSVSCPGMGQRSMRITKMASSHTGIVHMGNEQVQRVELHADGFWSTWTNTVCFGFNVATIAGGPKSGCINMKLLSGCQRQLGSGRFPANLWSNDIRFTRAAADGGVHKLVIEDVPKFATATESLTRNGNDGTAQKNLCESLRLVPGSGGSSGCPARSYNCNWVAACSCQSCAWVGTSNSVPDGCV